MPLNQALKGKTYPKTAPYEIGREKIREFAIAIGDGNPVYSDEEAAKAAGYKDLVAPPTFLTVLNFKYSPQIVLDPELGLDYSRVVHGSQEYELVRPLHPGDRLVAEAKISDIFAKGKNEFLIIDAEIFTEEGEKVAVARGTIVSRGTAPQEG
jgi:acyl dehydratase